VQAPPQRQPVQLPALDDSDAHIRNALLGILGKRAPFFITFDGFARRFVSTVDNLAKEQASPQMWPVIPTAGQFEAEVRADGTAVTAHNATRYAAFVRFVEMIDARKATAMYLRLYPLFQQAYEELGNPDKYFNDRVVAVIDHLLATPERSGPIRVKLVEVKGAPQRPGRLFQFEDPKDEARSAGQKILLRIGPDNAARLKAKLREARTQIARH
jgi:hypothetical protein